MPSWCDVASRATRRLSGLSSRSTRRCSSTWRTGWCTTTRTPATSRRGPREGVREAGELRPGLPVLQLDLRILINDTLNFLARKRPPPSLDPAWDVAAKGAREGPGGQGAKPGRPGRTDGPPGGIREVVVLRHFAELSYGEMSVALAIPEKTVKSRLYTARQRLAGILDGGRSMSRNEHDDLIQGEIDGVNPAPDSSRLRDLLASRPRPRRPARLPAARLGDARTGGAPRPASGLRGRGDVCGAAPEAGEGGPGGLARGASFPPAPAPLAACACTLLIGVLLGGLLPSDSGLFSRKEREALSGTALSHGRLDAAGALDRRSLALEGITGEVVTRIEEGLLVLDLELDATRPFDVKLDLERTGLSPRSFPRTAPRRGRGDGGGPGAVLPPGWPAPVQRLVRHRRSGGRDPAVAVG